MKDWTLMVGLCNFSKNHTYSAHLRKTALRQRLRNNRDVQLFSIVRKRNS